VSLLADAVLVLHAAFIAFVLLGGLLVLRWRRLAWLHLPCVAWGILIELSGGICPLTPLENRLRTLAGQQGYGESFIGHYLMPLIYPPGLTPRIQYLLAAIVLLVNLAVYVLLWRRSARGDCMTPGTR
jgi:hypothetical protein